MCGGGHEWILRFAQNDTLRKMFREEGRFHAPRGSVLFTTDGADANGFSGSRRVSDASSVNFRAICGEKGRTIAARLTPAKARKVTA
jgi:hypothetical protein